MLPDNPSQSREELVYLAKLAEKTERYEEMADYVIDFVKASQQTLSIDERGLVLRAFKNIVGHKRAACRILTNLSQKEERDNKLDEAEVCLELRSRIEKKIIQTCSLCVNLLDE